MSANPAFGCHIPINDDDDDDNDDDDFSHPSANGTEVTGTKFSILRVYSTFE